MWMANFVLVKMKFETILLQSNELLKNIFLFHHLFLICLDVCLEPDAVIPECSKWVNTETKEPVFFEHQFSKLF